MSEQYILIIDAGTSALRCHLFDVNGCCITRKWRPWSLIERENDHSLAREFDIGKVWKTLCSLIEDTLIDANIGPMQVEAIGVTSQRQGIAFLDKDHSELYMGPNMDLRAVFEGATIDQDHADDVYSITGHLPSFFFTPAKLRWFQIHRNQVYKNIAYALPLADWITFKLTGNLTSERSLAGEAGHLDIKRGDWASTLPEQLGLSINRDLELVDPGHRVGVITPLVSNQTGLSTGTSVVVCGADTQIGLLGLGAWNPDDVGIVAGWSSPLQMVTSKPILSPEAATWAGCYAAPDRWVLESSAGDIGNGYSWLVNTIWDNASNAYAQADIAANAISPGAEGTLAVLGPSRMDMRRLGLFAGGLLFPTPISFHKKSRGHLIRAVLEAGAYTIRANLEQAEALAGKRAATIALGGGMSKSTVFVSILANVLGRNISLAKEPATSALGAYFCTATTQRHFPSLRSAIASARDRLDLIEFQNEVSQEYDALYKKWLETAAKLKEIDL